MISQDIGYQIFATCKISIRKAFEVFSLISSSIHSDHVLSPVDIHPCVVLADLSSSSEADQEAQKGIANLEEEQTRPSQEVLGSKVPVPEPNKRLEGGLGFPPKF